jgi:putative peptide zinc metalloprotease protein
MEPSSGTLAVRDAAHVGRTRGERPDHSRASHVHGSRAAVPVRAQGIELLDRLAGSGYRDAPFLVRRGDGQTFQVTPLLYNVLAAIDGRRDYVQIAAAVSECIGKEATADDVRFLVERKLRLLGVLREPDGSEPTVTKMNPLLAIRCRVVVSRPDATRRITTPFAFLFLPPFVAAVLTTFVLSTGWLLFDKGLASGAHQVLYQPELLLLVFALMLVSAGFHEFGHAAACRYGGATPGAMGIGLYLLWPVFYTDVTDAYRLGRGGRLRVDLGGLYFNAVFAVGVFCVWVVTGSDALLVVVPLQVVQMLHQMLPLVRLDGYHILADLTGVPDLFARIKPTLLAAVPNRRRAPAAGALKPWVGVVVTVWVLVVVPVLALVLIGIVVTLPRVAATAWDSIGLQWDALQLRWAEGDAAGMGARVLSMLALAVPVLSMSYLTVRVGRRTARRVWRATAERPVLRGIAALVALSMVTVAASAWWPNGQYEPIQADDRGTLVDGFEASPGASPGSGILTSTRQGATPEVESVPGNPVGSSDTEAGSPTPGAPMDDGQRSAPAPGAVPREALPGLLPDLLPRLLRDLIPTPSEIGEGDNQALAVNTEDRTAIVALAFAVEWVDDGVVDNINEAYALASCVECLTVAIAFQAIFILGQADEVIPRNNAVAVNLACLECFTYALAAQLVVSLNEPLDDAAMDELAFVWTKLDELATRIEQMPLDEIDFAGELAVIESEILDVLVRAGALATDGDGALVRQTQSEPGATPRVVPAPSAAPAPTAPTSTTTTTTTTPMPPPSEPAPEPAPTTTPDEAETSPDPAATDPMAAP